MTISIKKMIYDMINNDMINAVVIAWHCLFSWSLSWMRLHSSLLVNSHCSPNFYFILFCLLTYGGFLFGPTDSGWRPLWPVSLGTTWEVTPADLFIPSGIVTASKNSCWKLRFICSVDQLVGGGTTHLVRSVFYFEQGRVDKKGWG